MNHRRTLESLFRLSLGTGCDPGAQRFLFFTRFPAPRGQQRERHRLTSNTREPLARASTRSTVHRKEWSNKRLLLDVKAASHNGSREIIASHRGQHHHHQRHDNVPFSLPWLRRRMWREGHGRTRRPGVCCVMQVQRYSICRSASRLSPRSMWEPTTADDCFLDAVGTLLGMVTTDD